MDPISLQPASEVKIKQNPALAMDTKNLSLGTLLKNQINDLLGGQDSQNKSNDIKEENNESRV